MSKHSRDPPVRRHRATKLGTPPERKRVVLSLYPPADAGIGFTAHDSVYEGGHDMSAI